MKKERKTLAAKVKMQRTAAMIAKAVETYNVTVEADHNYDIVISGGETDVQTALPFVAAMYGYEVSGYFILEGGLYYGLLKKKSAALG